MCRHDFDIEKTKALLRSRHGMLLARNALTLSGKLTPMPCFPGLFRFLEFGMPTIALNLGNGSVISKSVDYGCEPRERSTSFYLVINGMRLNMFIRILV